MEFQVQTGPIPDGRRAEVGAPRSLVVPEAGATSPMGKFYAACRRRPPDVQGKLPADGGRASIATPAGISRHVSATRTAARRQPERRRVLPKLRFVEMSFV